MKARDRTFTLSSPHCILTAPSFYSLKGHAEAELALELGGTGSILSEWQQLPAAACRTEQSSRAFSLIHPFLLFSSLIIHPSSGHALAGDGRACP